MSVKSDRLSLSRSQSHARIESFMSKIRRRPSRIYSCRFQTDIHTSFWERVESINPKDIVNSLQTTLEQSRSRYVPDDPIVCLLKFRSSLPNFRKSPHGNRESGRRLSFNSHSNSLSPITPSRLSHASNNVPMIITYLSAHPR